MLTKEILHFPIFQACAVTVAKSEGVEVEGKMIVPAGTIIGGETSSLIEDEAQKAIKKNGAGAEGVLLYDVDVTKGDGLGAMVFEGNINVEQLPEAPTAEAKADLKRITFWRKK